MSDAYAKQVEKAFAKAREKPNWAGVVEIQGVAFADPKEKPSKAMCKGLMFYRNAKGEVCGRRVFVAKIPRA